MANPQHHKLKVDLERFTILAPIPPFVDVILQFCLINRQEFIKIAELAASYPNDPRMIEMVRKAGDASAKVPYLMETGETPQSILEALREVASAACRKHEKAARSHAGDHPYPAFDSHDPPRV